VGEELAPLVAASVLFAGADPGALRELDACVFELYLEGLREAGWQGDTRLVRLGLALAAFLRYSMVLTWGAALDAEVRDAAAGSDQLVEQIGQGFVIAIEQKPDVAPVFVDL